MSVIWGLLLSVSGALLGAYAQEIHVSEVMPADTGLLADEDGEYSGWIEITNDEPVPMNLNGYGLSDDPLQPFKWTFTPMLLDPGAFLVVFTSGKNRRGVAAQVDPGREGPAGRDPATMPGLTLWLDAAASNTVALVDGRVARWQDKSGRPRVITLPPQISPDRVQGLALWLDGADTNTLELAEGGVAQWNDKSGRGNNAIQPVATSRPALVQADHGVLPLLRFDGRADFLTFPRQTEARTVFWVAREATEASDTFRPVLGDTDFYDFHRGLRGAVYLESPLVPVAVSSPQAWLNAEPINPLTVPLPKALAVVSTVVTNALRANTIGTDRQLTNRFWQGDIAEVLIYERALGADERAGLEQYLLSKWQPLLPPAATTYDAVQTDPTRRPRYTNDVLTGSPCLRLDGVRDYLTFPRLTGIRTVLWVGRESPDANQTYRPLLGDLTYFQFHRGDDGLIYSGRYADQSVVAGDTWLNGQPVDAQATRLPPAWGMLATRTTAAVRANTIGTDRLEEDHFWAGDVSEVLVFDRPLEELEIQALEQYLMGKWGLPAHHLHTSFTLTSRGQWLLLSAPNGTRLDQAPPVPVRPGLSLGHPAEGGPGWVYFADPTPARPNLSPAAESVTPDPKPSLTSGLFTAPISVALLTNALSGATYYTLDGSEPTAPLATLVDEPWIDDDLPSDAITDAFGGGVWNWVTNNPTPYSGLKARRSILAPGLHQHSFVLSQNQFAVGANDTLFSYIYLDPDNPPTEVMLQWFSGNWEHRAFWGADKIDFGASGTVGHFYAGPLPTLGQWARLEAPAAAVGLANAAVHGMSFTLFDGQATWDYSGKAATQSGSSQLYGAPLRFLTSTVLRARAYRDGAVPSEIVTASYFVGLQSSLPVVSVVTDPANLFDPQNGIFALGTNASGFFPYFGANFWKDWERPAHLEFFEPDGRRGFSQEGGIKTHGQWSRPLPQKSLTLYARRKYGPTAFQYPVFPGLGIDRFKHLVLRNGGNDYSETMFRDVMGQGLLDETGLDHQASRAVVAFINGRYWGIYFLRERVDADYVAAHHQGVGAAQVDLIENEILARSGDTEAYDALIAAVQNTDLAAATNYAAVAARMDIDNYIDYQVAELFCDNTDWPGRNISCWRPRTAEGKWQWLVMDLDGGFDIQGRGAGNNTLLAATAAAEPNLALGRSTSMLRGLVANGDFRQRFLNAFADHLNSTFLPTRVLAHIDAAQAELASETPAHIRRWLAVQDPAVGFFADVAAWNANVDVLRAFALQRPQAIRRHLANFFGLPGSAQLTLRAAGTGAGKVRVNRLRLETSALPWTGVYFLGVPLTVTAEPETGTRFVRWLGLPETNAALTLTLSGSLSLTAVFLPQDYDESTLHPRPFDLSVALYVFSGFAAASPAQTYPPNMLFQQTASSDPGLAVEMDSDWVLPYSLPSRSRLRGLGDFGFSFVNTGQAQAQANAGFLGAALLAVKTLGVTDVTVTWTGGTVAPNERLYAIRLQYRLGTQGPFKNVVDAAGQPVEYARSAIVGDFRQLGPVLLPAEVNNQPLVQLRWKYYYVPTGATGARAELRVDDILVTGTRSAGAGGADPTPGPLLRAVLQGRAGLPAVLESSPDLREWFPMRWVTPGATAVVPLEEPIDPRAQAQFFRLRSP